MQYDVVMKKLFLIFICCCLAACSNINKEELKKEIIAELQSNEQQTVVKGDGSNFYAEPVYLGSSSEYINEIYIQHSTINCPAIHNGGQRNCYKLNAYYNTFCSVCMSDVLISKWNDRFFPRGYKQ